MDEKLKLIMEKLNAAYDATDQIPASGAALDNLAYARDSMRIAYHAAKEALAEVLADG